MPTSLGNGDYYKPEYCEQLVAHMKDGFSYETFAARIDVARSTLYEWEKTHADWKQAKERAFLQCQLHWEQIGKIGTLGVNLKDSKGEVIQGGKINATMWIFNMKNRFKWVDRHEDVSPLGDLVNDAKEELGYDNPVEVLDSILEKHGKRIIATRPTRKRTRKNKS